MQWPNVGKIVSSIAHTVNNDVVKPVQRDVQRPVLSFLHNMNNTSGPPQPGTTPQQRAAYFTQTSPQYNQQLPGTFANATPVNPGNPLAIDPRTMPLATSVFTPADPQTQQIEDKAASQFSWTPEFKDIANAAQPITQAPTGGGLKGGVSGAATYQPGVTSNYVNSQRIKFGPGYGSSPAAVTHENLHAVWFDKPGAPQAFTKAYNAAATPSIKDYLNTRLQSYPDYQGIKSLDNFSKLPPSIQTEIHSYLSEYPTLYHAVSGKMQPPAPLPPALQKYYSRYINPNGVVQKRQDTGNILSTVYHLEHGYGQQDE